MIENKVDRIGTSSSTDTLLQSQGCAGFCHVSEWKSRTLLVSKPTIENRKAEHTSVRLCPRSKLFLDVFLPEIQAEKYISFPTFRPNSLCSRSVALQTPLRFAFMECHSRARPEHRRAADVAAHGGAGYCLRGSSGLYAWVAWVQEARR